MLQCRNPTHGKSILKRWTENGKFYAIQRCRKCDVFERIEIESFQYSSKPEIKRIKIEEQPEDQPSTNRTTQ